MDYTDSTIKVIATLLFVYLWKYGPGIKSSIIKKWEHSLKEKGLLKGYLVMHKIIKLLLYAILTIMVGSIIYGVVWVIIEVHK